VCVDILVYQVDMLINEVSLLSEIELQMRSLPHNRLKQLKTLSEPGILGLVRDKRESLERDVYYNSPRLSLLLRWCQTVCVQYDMDVDNFTVSFSDGRALCYLLHHYHPSLLPKELIRTETTQTYEGRYKLHGRGGEEEIDEDLSDDSLDLNKDPCKILVSTLESM